MGHPVELRLKGIYARLNDLSKRDVVDGIERAILVGYIFYIHFGTPCATWGPAGRLNKGSRSKTVPEGSGELAREVVGNEQARMTARLCRALIASNAYFSIENPAGSYFFLFDEIKSLSHSHRRRAASLSSSPNVHMA